MKRTMLKSKIHRATITGSDLNYVGSISIDMDLLNSANVLPYEQVTVVDINNGARFETYAIPGERGLGEVKVNGAAARLVHQGDFVIVMSYAEYEEHELAAYEPVVTHVGADNEILCVDTRVEHLYREPSCTGDCVPVLAASRIEGSHTVSVREAT